MLFRPFLSNFTQDSFSDRRCVCPLMNMYEFNTVNMTTVAETIHLSINLMFFSSESLSNLTLKLAKDFWVEGEAFI